MPGAGVRKGSGTAKSAPPALGRVLIHGQPPYRVAVLHGGPGAPGSAGGLARALTAGQRGVLEPWQSAGTLEGQIAELRAQLEAHAGTPVALVGHSWGAMLGYLAAAHHPDLVARLVMVGSGVFEERYADAIVGIRFSRLRPADRATATVLLEGLEDPQTEDRDRILGELGRLFAKTDTYHPLPAEQEKDLPACDYETHVRVWADLVALRRSGRLLELGRQIRCPVFAIHGDYDPHPADGVRRPLAGVLADFRFVLLEHCGHEPWKEMEAREAFLWIVEQELGEGG